MAFASSGQLTTDSREVSISETWETESDWIVYQQSNNIEVLPDGTVQLVEVPLPESESDDKLAHRWYLSEDPGPFEDQIGNADGTNNGTTQVTGDWVDNAAREGDASGYINVGNMDALSGSSLDSFSIAFSFQTETTGMVYGGSFESGSQAVQVGIGASNSSPSGSLSFRIDDDENSSMHYYTTATFHDGNPHRAVIVKDGNSASDVSMYVDGSEESVTNSVDQGGDVWADWSRDWYWLASENDGGSSNNVVGVLDDPCVFDSALTSTEATSYDTPWS